MTALDPAAGRRREGVVLLVVLFFVLLLAATIATFLRRVAVDAGIATNRDRARQAEALARGGVRLAQAVLLEDLRLDQGQQPPDSLFDIWARLHEVELVPDDPEISLHVDVEDAAARLDLNALAGAGAANGATPGDATGTAPGAASGGADAGQSGLGGGAANVDVRRLFLAGFLGRVIAAMPGRPEDKRYDPNQLAANLIDWVDPDDVRQSGGPEDEPYQARTPPTRPGNRPLLSVDELRLVEGFDGPLVDALRPYVTVFPLAGGDGINLNTAPPWVLAQLTRGSDVSGMRPVEEEDVRRVLDARKEGLVCSAAAEGTACRTVAELFDGDSIDPPMRDRSNVFLVRAVARVYDVERHIEAVIDRSQPSDPLRLSWRVE